MRDPGKVLGHEPLNNDIHGIPAQWEEYSFLHGILRDIDTDNAKVPSIFHI